jgi:uncharacterized protein
MAVNWRPLVLGGLSLAGSIWLLDGVTHVLGDWLPAMVLGSGGVWAYLKYQGGAGSSMLGPIGKSPAVNRSAVQTALAAAQGVMDQYAAESRDWSPDGETAQLSQLRSQLHQILSELDRAEIRIAVMGGPGVGKTTLTGLLKTGWAAELSPELSQLSLQDTPALLAAKPVAAAWQGARAADLILFLTDGDLTAAQLQALEQIAQSRRRLVLVLNKQDQYLPAVAQTLLAQLRDRVTGLLPPEDVVTIAAAPRPTKVRQHQPDGAIAEWLEEAAPDLQGLTDRLNHILLKDGPKLVLASALGEAEALKAAAAMELNQVRRGRAQPIIEKAQWMVAGTALANPVPALDLLAAAAINGQMVRELGELYQQKFSLSQGKTVAANLAGLMVKLGLVEVSTQAIGAVLKTNFVTYVAGGLLQGVSAAYLTRLAGEALIEYFESESQSALAPDRLEAILRRVFAQNQRLPFLQGFVQQAVDRLVASGTAAVNGAISSPGGPLPDRPDRPVPPDRLPPAQDALLQIPLQVLAVQPVDLPESVAGRASASADPLLEPVMAPELRPELRPAAARLEASI